MRKKIQEHTFNDPVSTPYGKANSSLRPDSFLKSLVILKIFALAALVLQETIYRPREELYIIAVLQ